MINTITKENFEQIIDETRDGLMGRCYYCFPYGVSVLNPSAVVENHITTICNSIYEDEKVITLSEVMLRNDALNLVSY
jgi:hypothetical protein